MSSKFKLLSKKVLSLFLSLLIITSVTASLDFSANAMSSEGSCGDNVTYSFDSSTGKLVISGNGDMYDYEDESEDNTENINYSPFYNNENIISIVIEEGITSIGNLAFEDCWYITNVTTPKSLKRIGDDAFVGCNNLNSVIIKSEELSLKAITFDSQYIKTAGPIGSGCNIEFAWSESIPDRAFEYCSNLTSIIIPDTVTEIGNGAFYFCSSLKNINIPSGLTSLGEYAFAHCDSLTKIVLPETLVNIGIEAFHCEGLNTAGPIGSGCNIEFGWKGSIPDNAFYYCPSLTNITIPNTITSIGVSAFSVTGLKEMVIPDSVTIIGDYAFCGCDSLIEISLPESITEIGEGAFSGSENLKSITIPGSVKKISDRMFYYCENLTDITIEEGVKEIGEFSFESCTSLKELTLPDGLSTAGCSAFGFCTSLETLSLPCHFTFFYTAFFGCDGLKDIYYRGPKEIWDIEIACNKNDESKGFFNAQVHFSTECNSTNNGFTYYVLNDEAIIYSYNGNGDKITIPSSFEGKKVTAIDNNAFYHLDLTSVTIPNSVERIGDNAFSYVYNLSSITLPDNLKSIGNQAFKYTNIKRINIPAKVENIGLSIIDYCDELTGITVDENNKYYDSRNNCNAIIETKSNTLITGCQNTIIPNSVTAIGDYAFSDVLNLTSITLPSGIKSIGFCSFEYCDDLTSIVIPNSIECIDSSAFSYCEKLKDVYYTGTKAQWNKINIGYCNSELTNANIHYNSDPSMHIHRYTTTVKAPTSTALGYTTYKCIVCGSSYNSKYKAPTGKVSGLKCSKRASDSQTVTWNTVKGASSYQIQISKKNSSEWSTYAHTSSNKYTFKKLTAGSNYKFRVRFYITQGGTKYYSPWSTTVSSPTLPSSTTISKVKAGKKSFSLTWKKKTFTGYQIQYSTSKNFKNAKTVKITKNKTTSKTIKGLKAKKKYYVRIRTYKTINGKNYYSAWSKSKSITTKK